MAAIGALVGGALGLVGASKQSKAASNAAAQERAAQEAGIAEQQRQFDIIQENFAPYLEAGTQGLQGQLDLLGLGAEGAEQAAIDRILEGPTFGALAQQGEDAILQNAAATGGLRGGNTQTALAQFRPQMLQNALNQQYSRLGGLAGVGQASAAQQAAAGQNFANAAQAGYSNIGQAGANAALAKGAAQNQALTSLGGLAGQVNWGNLF